MAGRPAVFVPALSLFTATIYAPFAIAVFLSDSGATGQRVDFVLIKVLICMVVGTALSAWRSATPLAVAPAVGLTAFFISGLALIHPEKIYWCSIAAGIAVLLLCITVGGRALRHHILEAVPAEVKQGVRGGVGALLAEKSVEDILHYDGHDRFRILAIALGTAALFAADFTAARRGRDAGQPAGRAEAADKPWRSAAFRLPLVFVPACIFIACAFRLHPAPCPPAPFRLGDFAVSLLTGPAGWALPDLSEVMNLATFSLVIVFVFLTDVPGTPYELLARVQVGGACVPHLDTPHGERAVRNSFLVDGVMAIFNALLLVPPSIYYAENFVLKNDRDEQHLLSGRAAAFYCAALCAVAVLVAAISPPVRDLSDWSRLAVAPVLLVVGIRIVAASMRSEHEESESGLLFATGPGGGVTILFYLPTALTIILSPIIGLQMSLPLGILAYCVTALLEGSDRSGAEARLAARWDRAKSEVALTEARTAVADRARMVTFVLLAVSLVVLGFGSLFSIPDGTQGKPRGLAREAACPPVAAAAGPVP